ncbi:MAG: hypothetical protein C0410_00235 [Anaerolinea sp.]|nr:hypothetical protein [Anaerolinea sp.]
MKLSKKWKRQLAALGSVKPCNNEYEDSLNDEDGVSQFQRGMKPDMQTAQDNACEHLDEAIVQSFEIGSKNKRMQPN